MSLEKIIAIAGKPGLFKLIAQTRGGFVAESLLDNKRLSVNVQQNVSVLSEIAIYTLTEEVPLRDVFSKINEKEQGKQASVSPKDSKDRLEEYFFEILPEYDEDRVYASDIKKVIQWYNLLQEHNMLDLLKADDADNTSDEEE
ncbi:hypothetical protein GCM10007962_18130 [Yeosuana aromativorans]|uniref:DUF5606 domain-containing protein n=1 Tax=Yeosuana aromativorans TaxID=288019 RepID=A0A8J3FGA2_9FLAO|nr:DUF5606 domain-containing protein [Yeosuana aromativorans]GGK24259.1 hypothetical protein GCM10007962_18130 [Yeosuana aromativorans]